MIPVIALVGRPNVGKSTLFNRLTRSRDALVAEFSGLTRDRQYGKGVLGDFAYIVVDTGGLSGDNEGIDKPMADQALTAVGEADLVLFIVDAKGGRTAADEEIARILRADERNVLLVANKIDGQDPDYVLGEFASLGLGKPCLISASQGSGVKYMIDDEVTDLLGDLLVDQAEEPLSHVDQGIKIAVVGRPNVGKSTLVNRLLGEERVVVFDEAGTTRDSIYIPYERRGQRYTLIDTAGIRRRGKVKEKVEKFSIIKTLAAIDDAHVVVLMIDATEGIVDQDLHLLGHVLDAGRAMVIAVNKWDEADLEQKTNVKREIDRRLIFIDFATTHFISALQGSGIRKLYESVHKAYDSATRKLQTRTLNDILEKAIQEHQPPTIHGRRIKLRYAHVGGNNPPIIVIHGNQTDGVPEAYKRYLQHKFVAALKLEGTPIRIQFKTSDNPYKDKKNVLSKSQVDSKRRLVEHVRNSKKTDRRKGKNNNW
jgi:GTP-binding protein